MNAIGDTTAALTAPSPSVTQTVALAVHPSAPWLAFPKGVMTQQLLDTPVVPIPNCVPWFKGVARRGSQILPVFDLALWAGLEAPVDARMQLVTVEEGDALIALLCSSSPSLLTGQLDIASPADADALRAHLQAGGSRPTYFHPARWLPAVAADVPVSF